MNYTRTQRRQLNGNTMMGKRRQCNYLRPVDTVKKNTFWGLSRDFSWSSI